MFSRMIILENLTSSEFLINIQTMIAGPYEEYVRMSVSSKRKHTVVVPQKNLEVYPKTKKELELMG